MEEKSNENKEVKVLDMGSLYDLNKKLVEEQEIELTESILNSKKEIVKNFMKKMDNNYYMLLCKEQSDYTIFRLEDKNNTDKIKEVINILVDECLKNRGVIKGIDITLDKQAIEMWLSIEGESYVYYFFPYDAAIIEV